MKIIAIAIWMVALTLLAFNLGKARGLRRGLCDGYRVGYIDGCVAIAHEIRQ